MIYIIILLVIIIGSYFYDYKECRQGKLVCWILLMIFMICVVGFRYRMGTDSIKYENYYIWNQHDIFHLTLNDFKDTRFAPFYILLCALCRSLSKEFMVLQFAVAIIVNTTFFWFLWKNSKHCFLGVLLYYFFLYLNLNMEVLREAIAVSFFLVSWPYFKKGQWGYYYIFAVLAFLSHLSAIVLFFLPLICLPGVRWFFKFGLRTWLLCVVVMIAAFAINVYFFDFIQAVAMTENMAERAQVYSKTDLGGSTLNVMGIIPRLIKYIIYPSIALAGLIKLRQRENRLSDEGFTKFEMMTVLSMYFSVMAIGVTLFIRYNNYFQIFPIVMMSNWIFTSFEIMGKRIQMGFGRWLIILLPLLVLQFYTTYYNDYNKSGTLKYYMMFYPYSNQFNQNIEGNREKMIQYSRRL